MLLTVNEIEQKLVNKFSSFTNEMDDLILKKRECPPGNLVIFEKELHVKLPADFFMFLNRYDLDNFSLGNFAFGSGSDYINKLIQINNGDDINHWWSESTRPAELILIAISDPYSIIINTVDSKLYAISSEPNEMDLRPISDSFELFFRALGTLFLKCGNPDGIVVYTGAKNQNFWHVI